MLFLRFDFDFEGEQNGQWELSTLFFFTTGAPCPCHFVEYSRTVESEIRRLYNRIIETIEELLRALSKQQILPYSTYSYEL